MSEDRQKILGDLKILKDLQKAHELRYKTENPEEIAKLTLEIERLRKQINKPAKAGWNEVIESALYIKQDLEVFTVASVRVISRRIDEANQNFVENIQQDIKGVWERVKTASLYVAATANVLGRIIGEPLVETAKPVLTKVKENAWSGVETVAMVVESALVAGKNFGEPIVKAAQSVSKNIQSDAHITWLNVSQLSRKINRDAKVLCSKKIKSVEQIAKPAWNVVKNATNSLTSGLTQLSSAASQGGATAWQKVGEVASTIRDSAKSFFDSSQGFKEKFKAIKEGLVNKADELNKEIKEEYNRMNKP
jgi:hypothetical protein